MESTNIADSAEVTVTHVKPKEPTLEIADLQRLLQEEKQERARRCEAEIAAVLNRWKCTLDFSVVVKQSGITPVLEIVALDNNGQ